MTYNVNYGLEGDPAGVAVLADGWADMVLLQETTPTWERHLRSALGHVYPHMAFRHCCGAGGLAALSKHPFEERDYLPARAGWFPAWRLVFDSHLGPLQVLVVHLRPQISDTGSVLSGYFTTPAIREREIREHFGALDPSLPTLVAGDFNEGPGGRALVFLKDRGLRSALGEFDTPQDTWRWPTSLGAVEMQLDHLAYDERLEPLDVQVRPVGRSDHWPVAGVFALRVGQGEHGSQADLLRSSY
jgi:endonuclease/exonuclease/phosphatase (EEP) superfamily protein YafD